MNNWCKLRAEMDKAIYRANWVIQLRVKRNILENIPVACN